MDVFVSDVSLVHEVVSTGITTESSHFIMASPLITPVTRVVISNAPPFISHDNIMSVLSRYEKMFSRMSMIPLGCWNERVKHVMSFRRQIHMVLPHRGEDTGLNVSFKINFEDTNLSNLRIVRYLNMFPVRSFRTFITFLSQSLVHQMW